MAVSIFDYLTSEFERGRGAAALSTALGSALPRADGGVGVAASSTSAPSALAPFVAANENNLGWNAQEVTGADLPENIEKILIRWLVDDLNTMGESDEWRRRRRWRWRRGEEKG